MTMTELIPYESRVKILFLMKWSQQALPYTIQWQAFNQKSDHIKLTSLAIRSKELHDNSYFQLNIILSSDP